MYPIDPNEHNFTSEFERTLYHQFYVTMVDTKTAWTQCKEIFNAPQEQGMFIFANPNLSFEKSTWKSAKCLFDCTMRKTGVVSTVINETIASVAHHLIFNEIFLF